VIIPDANLLLYAYNEGARRHKAALAWWEKLVRGSEEIGLPWIVALAFIRISTNPRITAPAVPVREAVQTVEAWLATERVRILQPGIRHASILFELLGQVGTAGNLTTDAHIAALAIEYQAVVHTTDTDFARFSGCRWVNPLER
jgi:hypothetical protein